MQNPQQGHDRLKRGRWSQNEIARLKELYGLRDEATIARELGRTVASVRKMAETVCRAEPRKGPWTANEVQRLKEYLGVTAPEVIARLMGRPLEEVQSHITDLGRIQEEVEWTRDEVFQFKRIYGTRTNEDLTRIFGRPLVEIERLAAEYALAKDKAFLRRLKGDVATKMPRWTQEELDKLRELYPTEPNLEVAKALGRSVKSVVSKAHNLGLKKNPERLRQMGRENVSHRYREGDEGSTPSGEIKPAGPPGDDSSN